MKVEVEAEWLLGELPGQQENYRSAGISLSIGVFLETVSRSPSGEP